VNFIKTLYNSTSYNSRFSQLRILLNPVADFPLENLILVENMRSRSSQLTRSGGTLVVIFKERLSMTENIKFKCSCCGKIHEEWPALTFISPDNYNNLSEEDKISIGNLDADFCTIKYEDQTNRFIRCVLIQKVNDHCEDLDYGLWVSLSETSYLDYKERFQRESEEKLYFGWLCNNIPGYEFSESIPMNVVSRNNGLRPELIPHEGFDHPFVKDYYNGISKEEAERRISEMLGIVSENSNGKGEVEIKKWWQVWK